METDLWYEHYQFGETNHPTKWLKQFRSKQ